MFFFLNTISSVKRRLYFILRRLSDAYMCKYFFKNFVIDTYVFIFCQLSDASRCRTEGHAVEVTVCKCRITDDLHLTDGKMNGHLTDGLERCWITDKNPPTLKKNHSVVHATGKCQKSDNTAVGFLVEM